MYQSSLVIFGPDIMRQSFPFVTDQSTDITKILIGIFVNNLLPDFTSINDVTCK